MSRSNLLNRMLTGQLNMGEDIYVYQTMTDINFYMILGSSSSGLYGIKATHHICEGIPLSVCTVIYNDINVPTHTLLDFRLLTNEDEYKLIKSKMETFILTGENVYRKRRGLEPKTRFVKEDHITLHLERNDGVDLAKERDVVYSYIHGKYIYK